MIRTAQASIEAPGPLSEGPRELLTAQEVAQLLSVPATWVYAQTRTGRIPTVRLGRYYRYRPAAISSWVEASER